MFYKETIRSCLILRDHMLREYHAMEYMKCFARFGTICTIEKTWKTPMECFSRFSNCANGANSCNALHISD